MTSRPQPVTQTSPTFSAAIPGVCLALALALTLALSAPGALAQPAGELFPQPFVVEHYMVQIESDGTRFVSETVEDLYAGSWLVSRRADGSRTVLDLARREITEIRPSQGIYWSVGFNRLAELQRRFDRLDELPGAEPAGDIEAGGGTKASLEAEADRLVVTERAGADPSAGLKNADRAMSTEAAPGSLHARAGVRRLQIARGAGDKSSQTPAGDAGAEVWVDGSIRLSPAARAALAGFERDALGGYAETGGGLPPAAVMKAAREHADGAFPVRTRRTVAGGVVESITTRLEAVETFDRELVRVPDGLRRVPHPLESAVAFMEKEAERRQMMGSMPR